MASGLQAWSVSNLDLKIFIWMWRRSTEPLKFSLCDIHPKGENPFINIPWADFGICWSLSYLKIASWEHLKFDSKARPRAPSIIMTEELHQACKNWFVIDECCWFTMLSHLSLTLLMNCRYSINYVTFSPVKMYLMIWSLPRWFFHKGH